MTATLFSRSPPTLLGRRMYAEAKEDQYRSRKATRLPQLLVREQITRANNTISVIVNGPNRADPVTPPRWSRLYTCEATSSSPEKPDELFHM